MELNTILNIMSDNNLSADELLLIYLTINARDEEGHSELFAKWFTDCDGKSKLKTLFEGLKEKGIIKKNFNPETYIPNEIEFNKNFIKKYYKQSGILGEELFNNYESFIYIKGNLISLKNISKKFYTLDEFYFYYSSQIGHDPEKHKEVMDILRWAKENELVHTGILEFVASRQWNLFKEMREEGYTPRTASAIDVVESL